MVGGVDWGQLILLATAVTTACGIVLSAFAWIYRDSNNKNKQIADLAKEMGDSISKLREDVSKSYVSVETHALISRVVEKAIDDLKRENKDSIERLGNRLDAALLVLAKKLEH